MRNVCFKSTLFSGGRDKARSEKALGLFLKTLCQLDIDFLRTYPQTPSIYVTGVVYRKERFPLENWKTVPIVIKDGFGDCEDLACWRAAEFRVRGIAARPVFRSRQVGNIRIYHIVVRLPDGRIEDPSKRLGMKGIG